MADHERPRAQHSRRGEQRGRWAHLPASRFSGRRVARTNGAATCTSIRRRAILALAAAAESIDAAGAARLYATLTPLFDEAHRELGNPDRSFDDVVEQAIVRLLNAPTLADPVPLVPRGIGYAFEHPEVERLTAAQKQLLRFGPANVRTIQAALRRIGSALGIPAARLR